ncbi:MAG TPA: SusC/RagA family TonB-linked outer membrane protein, partial [Sphingobacteriaceae bacterium]
MKKNLLSFFFLLLFAVTAWAQDRTVTGTVTAREDGLPLPGVSIVVKGTRIGTQADANGKFSLRVPSGSNQLEFRFLGYNTHTATIGASNVVNVALSGDAKQLGEVVVTGYGTQRKKDFTGSAASVSGDKIKDSPVQSFDQALGGKASGVNIIQPNGVLNNPPVIRIRGFNSISLSSFPLVVVDGIPINTGDNSSNSAANNALGDINPADIESIDILKDAASTAIYGSRGAAGVLIITTKKGKSGAAKMTYDGWYGFTNAVRTPEVLNAQQYMEVKNEAVLNSKILGGNASNPAVASELFFPDYDQNGNLISTNWFNEVYRTAQSMNHSLSISGGTEKTSYYFSGNYSDQDGFIKKNSFERKAARFNVDHNATNWLKLSANVNYTNNFNSAPNTGSLPGQAFNTSGLGRLAFVTAPNVAARNPDGSYNIRTDNTMGRNKNLTQSGFVNPLPILDNNSFTSESGRLIGNFAGTFSLYKGLSFRTSYGMDRLNVESSSFASPIHGDGFTNKGDANNSYQRLDNWNWSNTLNYATTIGGKHSLSMLTGYEVQSFNNNAWSGSRSGVADIFFDTYQGNYTLNNPPGTIYRIRRAFESYLASLNYDFGKRYFITANFRRDGNSALAA